jgi:ribosomal protein L16/L10AE
MQNGDCVYKIDIFPFKLLTNLPCNASYGDAVNGVPALASAAVSVATGMANVDGAAVAVTSALRRAASDVPVPESGAVLDERPIRLKP